MSLLDPKPLLAKALAWLADLGFQIEDQRQLEGSTSAAVFLLQGRERLLILRLFTLEGWLEIEPDLATHEAAVLQTVNGIDVATPQLLAVDEDGSHCGVPAVVMSCLPGRVLLPQSPTQDYLNKLAQALVEIHTMPVPDFAWHYRSWLNREELHLPRWTKYPDLWQRAIEIASRPEPTEPTVFIHRDYHPTNVLWQDGDVSGVVDWVNACLGPAGVDISHCRANLDSMYGIEVANAFLEAYKQQLPYEYEYDPYWDIVTTLERGIPSPWLYPPWGQFGLKVTKQLLFHRADQFLSHILNKG